MFYLNKLETGVDTSAENATQKVLRITVLSACVRCLIFLISLTLFCWHTCASARVFWSKCSDPLLFSQGSAAPTLLFLWAGQGSSLAAFRQGSAAFLYFSGQQASRRCQVGGRHLPFVSYGHFQITIPVLSDFTVSAPLDRSAPLTFVTGRFYSNSCSADSLLFVILVLREEFAFLFQTFPEMTLVDIRRRRGAVLS